MNLHHMLIFMTLLFTCDHVNIYMCFVRQIKATQMENFYNNILFALNHNTKQGYQRIVSQKKDTIDTRTLVS